MLRLICSTQRSHYVFPLATSQHFFKSSFMYYVGMPTITTSSKTKWIGYRGTLPEHTAIKTAAARKGLTVGDYIRSKLKETGGRSAKRRAAEKF